MTADRRGVLRLGAQAHRQRRDPLHGLSRPQVADGARADGGQRAGIRRPRVRLPARPGRHLLGVAVAAGPGNQARLRRSWRPRRRRAAADHAAEAPVSDRGSVLRPASWRRRPKPTHEALRRVRAGRTRDRALPTPTASARTTRQPSTPQQTSTPVVHSADLSVAASALDASEQRREARRASKGSLLLDKRASLRAPGSRLGGKSSGGRSRPLRLHESRTPRPPGRYVAHGRIGRV